MSFLVCSGALLQCSFGLAPSQLMVTLQNRLISQMPIANIMDNKPFLNILPFCMCQSISNPSVAAATAAAMGVLTPMPCIPVHPAPWIPGSSTVTLSGYPVLNDSCILNCMYGGIIKINTAGQSSIQV